VRDRVRDERVEGPEGALDVLKQEMTATLAVDAPDPLPSGNGSPHVVLMVGVNGAGKTTSIAKLAQLYLEQEKKVVLGAADTFRAAAIDQLQEWGRRLDLDVIAHQPGSDAGAVAFDAVEAATARRADVVIIDTAGRLHTKFNLMEEIKKVQRVISRRVDEQSQTVVLALDATTGQNGLLQARAFTEALKCDGVFLAKLDSSAKGGVVLAVVSELQIPVLFIGTGEQPDDVAPFDAETFVESLFAPADTD
jgi:fused signal recognition particle receptor